MAFGRFWNHSAGRAPPWVYIKEFNVLRWDVVGPYVAIQASYVLVVAGICVARGCRTLEVIGGLDKGVGSGGKFTVWW